MSLKKARIRKPESENFAGAHRAHRRCASVARAHLRPICPIRPRPATRSFVPAKLRGSGISVVDPGVKIPSSVEVTYSHRPSTLIRAIQPYSGSCGAARWANSKTSICISGPMSNHAFKGAKGFGSLRKATKGYERLRRSPQRSNRPFSRVSIASGQLKLFIEKSSAISPFDANFGGI